MKWRKAGHVFRPDGSSTWARHSALQPTPLLVGDKIRVFTGLRDDSGVSRVGWVDLDASSPGRVLDVSQSPALDVGVAGAFDDNGVVPCAVLQTGDTLRLYYAGYQLGHRVRFLVFGGAAESRDGGFTFERLSRVPVTDRTDRELFFRVIHSIRQEGDGYRAWYGGGDRWELNENCHALAVYDVRTMWSKDGLRFPSDDFRVCVPCRDDGDEHRVGRPYVFEAAGRLHMFFGAGTRSKLYRLAYAWSTDGGLTWKRDDAALGISESADGWDAMMMGYPAVVSWKDRTYLFYNGNDMGRAGFGYAELEAW